MIIVQIVDQTVTFRDVEQPDGSLREEVTCTCGWSATHCDHVRLAMGT